MSWPDPFGCSLTLRPGPATHSAAFVRWYGAVERHSLGYFEDFDIQRGRSGGTGGGGGKEAALDLPPMDHDARVGPASHTNGQAEATCPESGKVSLAARYAKLERQPFVGDVANEARTMRLFPDPVEDDMPAEPFVTEVFTLPVGAGHEPPD